MSEIEYKSPFHDKYLFSQKFLEFVSDRLTESNPAFRAPTQQELAEEIGVKQPMISHVKCKRKYFGRECYERYSSKIDMPLSTMISQILRLKLMVRSSDGAHAATRTPQMIEQHLSELQRKGSAEADFDGILQVISQVFQVGHGAIFLRKPNTDIFCTAASLKTQSWLESDHFYRIGEGVTGWILKHKRVVRVRNLRDSAELERVYPPDPPVWKAKSCLSNRHLGENGYAYLGVPIHQGDNIFGVIRIIDLDNDRVFTDSDEAILVYIAECIAEFLEKANPSQVDKVVTKLQHDSAIRSYSPTLVVGEKGSEP
jgi:transcriptional regulator with GAF, ATPase, and Fis domain